MPLLATSLAQVCRAVADHLAAAIHASDHDINVVIGVPHDAAEAGNPGGKHVLNLFFYRFEPSAFQAGLRHDEPWHLRLHCLATAFSVEEQHRTVGEGDLRILGEVLRVFHEDPVLDRVDVSGEDVRLQVVYEALTLDQLNQLWSSQGDTALRPSLAFEMAVAPVVPSTRAVGSPLVGALGMQAVPRVVEPAAFSGLARAPEVTAGPPAHRADWTPHICLVGVEGCSYTAVLPLGTAELVGFVPAVWAAGRPGSTIRFEWDTWAPGSGWDNEPSPVTTTVVDAVIDPASYDAAGTVAVPLPFDDHAGQAVLVAVRDWVRADGTTVALRSNPVVITLFEGEP